MNEFTPAEQRQLERLAYDAALAIRCDLRPGPDRQWIWRLDDNETSAPIALARMTRASFPAWTIQTPGQNVPAVAVQLLRGDGRNPYYLTTSLSLRAIRRILRSARND